ncbi:MAG TPA: hypothetical protein VFM31_10770, partial [Nitrososphaeraceae archaeon]|nr:hypothetical protein [Nitrososphaeraceae archaeon]
PTITSLHFVPIVVVRVPIIIEASFLSQSFFANTGCIRCCDPENGNKEKKEKTNKAINPIAKNK